jgi:hypothetical protein
MAHMPKREDEKGNGNQTWDFPWRFRCLVLRKYVVDTTAFQLNLLYEHKQESIRAFAGFAHL